MTSKSTRWSIKHCDETVAGQLQSQLGIHPVLCSLLAQRGVNSYEEARQFFRPALDKLHDPFLMKDMDKAVNRIQAAILQNEKILIYGDYDVDGTTAVSLVYSFITNHLYKNTGYYIPDRYNEGYGISIQGIDYAAENDYSLVIALDCGIKALDKIAYANSKNVDVIVCDHHRPGGSFPKAVAVLDPQRDDCGYPYKELSGAGIGFKLAQALAGCFNIPFQKLESLLDLVAVSIASDIVPITGENRILAYYGLRLINSRPRAGLKAMIQSHDLRKEMTVSDLVFIIGPRINAAGRMDDARTAVKLLTEEDEHAANEWVARLNENNDHRKQHDISITEEAIEFVKKNIAPGNKTTVVYGDNWHKGVIGIVASRLIEKFYRPTIVLTRNNDHFTGSARSVRGFDIYEAISACDDLLAQYGGHKYAAGLTLKEENLKAFVNRFESVVSETIDPELLTPEISIDSELSFGDISGSFYKILRQFAPFGPGNMTPVFVSKQLFDDGYSRIVGEKHLRLSLRDGSLRRMSGIAFNRGDLAQNICNSNNRGQKAFVDVCYTIEQNEWQGRRSLQINVKDIRMCESEVLA